MFLLVILGYVLWQWQELRRFEVTSYEVKNQKVNKKLKLVVISDLHSFSYGEGNARLLKEVKKQQPDLILCPGDLIVSSKTDKYDISLAFVKALTAICPVYAANGNHESRVELEESKYHRAYEQYKSKVQGTGVHILNNESSLVDVGGCKVRISGLEIPLASYEKGKPSYLDPDYLNCHLGDADAVCLQILLAHNPAFAKLYAAWGADITLCGHNHGGLVRIPGIGSVISPQYEWFPKYDAGEFDFDGKRVYVSRGLGTHSFHIRIFNRAELLTITVVPKLPE